MSEVLEREAPAETKTGVIDCDIHPAFSKKGELGPYLPPRWRDHVKDFGLRTPSPFQGALPYPRMGHGMRRDSYPPDGGAPASNLDLLREQLLDPLNIEFGLLHALNPGPAAFNLDLSAAVCSAMNDWQIDKWLDKEPRLRGGIVVPQEDPAAAVAEIEARAGDPRFVQVTLHPRSIEPLGRRKYWPIYEAAAVRGLPVAMHTAAYGTYANNGAGWSSYYLEEHYSLSHACQSAMVSMIFEGVFERLPALKLVLVESGFAWLAPLMWRMDREWQRMREEVPHMTKKPADVVRSNVWLTTQPVEEPPKAALLTHLLKWLGADRLMFSSDYPHWDFDHPERVFAARISPQDRQAIFRGNALAVYKLYP